MKRSTRLAWYFVALIAAAMILSPLVRAQEGAPVLLVAVEELQGAYRGTVILAAPIGNDEHVGVILNKPTRVTLAQLFPTHAPSQKVEGPVYYGGPTSSDNLFAMVRGQSAPHPHSFEIAPGVWLVFNGQAVDNIIEATPNEARYFAGVVAWRPGELEEELKKGYFVRRAYDAAKLFLPDTSQMHEALKPKRGQVSM